MGPKYVLVPIWKPVHGMRSDLALESSTNNKDAVLSDQLATRLAATASHTQWLCLLIWKAVRG
jgi:hypothetical protein